LAEQNRNLDEAERLIRRAIELDRRARSAGDSDDFEEEQITENDNAAYLDSLAWVLFRKGKLGEARQWLEKALALPDGKHDATVWDHFGDVCYRLKDVAKAREAW